MKNTLLLYSNTKTKTKEIELSKYLAQVLTGQLLGDANCSRSSPTSNTRITWSFGLKYEAYSEYIADLFKGYGNTGIYYVKSGIRLKTLSSSVFNEYYNMFYILCSETEKMKKIVPKNIMRLMTPITLAHLIMGDGNYDKGRNRVRIYTNSFSLEDCELLARSIKNMGIEVNVMKDKLGSKGQQYILTIGAKQLPLLQKLISPYMHESMLYRIGL